MTAMPIHTIESAPPGSRATLEQVTLRLGAIPNLAAGMAEAPSLIQAFFTMLDIYGQGTLSAQEIQLISLINARENDCSWCVAFHSRAALKAGASEEAVKAARAGGLPTEVRAQALCRLAQEMVRTRGKVSDETRGQFAEAGLSQAQALEVVLGVGFSTLANYAFHLIEAPLEEGLRPYAWSREAPAMASTEPQPAT